MRIIKVLFRNYYRNNPLSSEDIPSIERREIAYQNFNGVFVRHRKFNSLDELNKAIVEEPPLSLYYSVAYYEEPEVEDMEGKGWLGAELVFDIDADHLPTRSCGNLVDGIVDLACLADAAEETTRLIEVLREELGFKDVRVYFSGNRGFHVHIGDEEVRGLSQEERRELVGYLTAKGLDLSKFLVPVHKGLALAFSCVPEGNLRRIYQALIEVGAREIVERDLVRARRGLEKWANVIRKYNDVVSEKLRFHIDELVAVDVRRLIRAPNSLHGKTGLRVVRVREEELDNVEKIVEKAVAFKRGELDVVLKREVPRRVLGLEIPRNKEGEVIRVPIYLGVYLVLQGLAELHERSR